MTNDPDHCDDAKKAVARAILSGVEAMVTKAEEAALMELKPALSLLNEAVQRTLGDLSRSPPVKGSGTEMRAPLRH